MEKIEKIFKDLIDIIKMFLYSALTDISQYKNIEKIGCTTNVALRKFYGQTFNLNPIKYKWYIQINNINTRTLILIEEKVHNSLSSYSVKKGGGTEFFEVDIDTLEKVKEVLEGYKYEVFTEDLFVTKPSYKSLKKFYEREIELEREREGLKQRFVLKEYQKNALNNFEKRLEEKQVNTVLSMATGTGKTICTLAMINKFNEMDKRSILWVTRRKDILKTQFCKNNFLKYKDFFDISNFEFKLYFENQSFNTKDIRQKNKPLFIVLNTDKIIKKYKKIPDIFGMIVLDECHSVGASLHYQMFQYFKNKLSYKIMIGLSATPYREDTKSYDKMLDIFGDGSNMDFLYVYDFLTAINDNVLAKPHFYYTSTNINEDVDKDKIIDKLKDMYGKCSYKNAILWVNTKESADEWKKILDNNFKNVYCSHSDNDKELKEINSFISSNSAILLVVGRAREGFDKPSVCLLSSLDPVKEHQSSTFIQMLGRGARKLPDKEEFFYMDNFFTEDSFEESVAEKLFKLIQSLTREYSQNNLIAELSKNGITVKSDSGNEIFYSNLEMKECKWDIIYETLNKKLVLFSESLSYTQCKKLIKRANIPIKDKEDYLRYVEKMAMLPRDPEKLFREKWKGWEDYLDSDTQRYYSKEEFLGEIRKRYNGERNYAEFYKTLDGKRFPIDPLEYYKFKNYEDLFMDEY